MSSFIQQSLVFIGAAIILVPIFHFLGLGSILGYLAGGILVGPSGLRLIQDSESTLHFAELGVVLLLFVIGLEIQPQKLWQMRKKLFSLGLLQVLFCTLIFTGIGMLFGLNLTTAGLIGFGLSLSSTAFALQSLSDANELNTEFGQSAFAILLMQDLTAIPALAIVPIFFATSVSTGHEAHLGYLPFILIGLSLSSRFLLRPLFRFVAKTRAKEIFTAASLFVVLGVAAIMVKAGLSAALGTFIAGVLLADSEYRHELEANIEPFKSLLMGLFFMAVGMGVSLDLIVERPLQVFGFAILYFFIKWGVIYGVGRLSRMSHEHSRLMGLSIAQGGEFAFVIFTMGLGIGLLEQKQVAFLTAIVTVSMVISALMNYLNDKYLAVYHRTTVEPQYDHISESPSVIIAGFGRFGQIFGRLLRSQKIDFVAIDHDSDQIELLRKFGNKVYYGDATREDLLISAGIKNAKYMVIAIDDVDNSLKVARMVTEHFPHIKIFGRARNRGHAFEYLELGITHIKRETFDSSINFAGELLVEMGVEKERAINIIRRFKAHDETMLKEQFKVRSDDKMFVDVSKQAVAQLEQVLREEGQMSYVTPPEKSSINS